VFLEIFPVGTHAECDGKIKFSGFIKIVFSYQQNTSCNKIKCAHCIEGAKFIRNVEFIHICCV
jgi:hypothetical protein